MKSYLLFQVIVGTVLADNYLTGQNATLHCNVVSTKEGFSLAKQRGYVWRKQVGNKQGRDVVLISKGYGNEEIKVENGILTGRAFVKSPQFFIHDLRVSDTGMYFCNIMLESVDESSKTYIDVNAVPAVHVEPIRNSNVDENSGYYNAAICHAKKGKPEASLKWINSQTGKVQHSFESTQSSSDGTFNVSSVLRLKPGLIGRPANSTKPITRNDWIKNFTCVVTHDYFPNDDKEWRETVAVQLLYVPVASVSVMGNKLTCNVFGKPRPKITWSRPDGTAETGRKSIFVDQSNPDKSSGRYFCLAENSIGQSNVASVDIRRPQQLPTIFTSTLRYDASIPLKARDYDIECLAELNRVTKSTAEKLIYVWTKDDMDIQEELSAYKIFGNTTQISEEKTMVRSTLRIMQVERPRDEGIFKCRLSVMDLESGYVRAVEKRIKIIVDYPPASGSVRVIVRPSSPISEGSDVTLSCRATSQPSSTFRWFFNGKEISFGRDYVIRNVSRNQAGMYKCVASNYVPGSASAHAVVGVNYPPGRVVITKTKEGLSCVTETGSIPPPIYTWFLPNGTVTKGNQSFLRIPTSGISTPASYICLVRNILAEANCTYFLAASGRVRIGSLSIGEFVGIVIVSILLFTILISSSVLIAKRRNWGRKSVVTNQNRSTKTSNLLKYNEHPYGGSLASMSTPHNVFDDKRSVDKESDTGRVEEKKESIESVDYSTAEGMPNGKSGVMSSKVDGKPSLMNYASLNSRSSLEQNRVWSDAPSRYKSLEVINGAGVQISDNSSHGTPGVTDAELNPPRSIINVVRNSPLKLTTFSQPSSGLGDRPDVIKNYFTTRKPSREKPMELPLTRAHSEIFKQTHNYNAQINSKTDTSTHMQSSTVCPPTYARVLSQRKLQSPRPEVLNTTTEPALQDTKEKMFGYHSDSSSSSSSRRKEPLKQQQVSPASESVDTTRLKYPSLRHNFVSRDNNSAYPLSDSDFRESPVPSRCQSVDPTYTSSCTPPMAELPIRSYLYQPQPYTDVGLSQVTPKTNIYSGSTASPYDSGSDSTKSSNTATVTPNGRKMQSLTLV